MFIMRFKLYSVVLAGVLGLADAQDPCADKKLTLPWGTYEAKLYSQAEQVCPLLFTMF